MSNNAEKTIYDRIHECIHNASILNNAESAPPEVKAKDIEVLKSFLEFFNKKGELTPGQMSYFRDFFEKKYSETAVSEYNEFAKKFNDPSTGLKEKFILACKIQEFDNSRVKYARYWEFLIVKAANPDFVPQPEVYKKFVENKFMKGKMEAWYAAPRFRLGETVLLRSNAYLTAETQNFIRSASESVQRAISKGLMVIQPNAEYPLSHARGSKRYLVMPYLDTKTKLFVDERELKSYQIK